MSRTVDELFVRPNCVIYGQSDLVYKSNGQTGLSACLIALVSSLTCLSKCQTVAAGELVSTVSKFGFQVSDFISTVSGLRFHDGQLRFHESDFLRPPVSFSFP